MSICLDVYFQAPIIFLIQLLSLPWFFLTHPFHFQDAIASDEYAWRRNNKGFLHRRWRLSGTYVQDQEVSEQAKYESVKLPKLQASQVARVYRELRRSREAKSDAPGSTDFYYGEMEMRRHSKETIYSDKAILWLYWAISGYGLKASRSLILLALLVVLSAFSISFYGFADGATNLSTGLVFAFQSIIPGIRNTKQLTDFGNFIEIVLAFFGPALLALSIFAIRGRVKR